MLSKRLVQIFTAALFAQDSILQFFRPQTLQITLELNVVKARTHPIMTPTSRLYLLYNLSVFVYFLKASGYIGLIGVLLQVKLLSEGGSVL